jgi:hypothetical protein
MIQKGIKMKIIESETKHFKAWLLDNGFHESLFNGVSHGYVNKELKQCVSFDKGIVEAYTIYDFNRYADTDLMSRMWGAHQLIDGMVLNSLDSEEYLNFLSINSVNASGVETK